ncbi:hypothetical protein SAMN05428974_2538 [Sphingopyxis sp. YR583]|uniref:NrsF family protein n=1 Tax=Sphingopyxis sp. YR583 TaxID=1881047 RepID=UPI0008A777BA|nr:DUF1109 domain-containing protein [Sphingopyxis sp. YR583]SEH18311.1 hypothetical protein SAMN05428974_2538 [Sphingopyxis sp. YR583]
MTMKDASIDDLIDGLAGDLTPVRPRRVARGSLWVAAGWLGVGAMLVWLFGMRPGLGGGVMPPLSMLAFWLIAATGVAAAWSALRMGLPGVGRDYGGWRWAVGALLALPLAALAVSFGDAHTHAETARVGFDVHCLLQGIVSGLGVGAALFLWLRAGAPTSPTRAGWVIGIAAGAAGASIVALLCSSDDLVHITLWHASAVPVSAVAGRLVLPRFLRW